MPEGSEPAYGKNLNLTKMLHSEFATAQERSKNRNAARVSDSGSLSQSIKP